MAASARALGTTELLEAILFNLNTKQLLFAQKVSKHWKALIEGSTRLQQALFFRALPGNLHTKKEAYSKYATILANPLLANLQWAMTSWESLSVALPVQFSRFNPQTTPARIRKEASWRKMLATQPAVEGVYRSMVRTRRQSSRCAVHEDLSFEGATMGEMVVEFEQRSKVYLVNDGGEACEWGRQLRGHLIWCELMEELERNEQLEDLIAYAKMQEKKVSE